MQQSWEDEVAEYWLVWKPFVGVPGVVTWWWSLGTIGISPREYLEHADAVYTRGRAGWLRDYGRSDPGVVEVEDDW